MHFMHLFDNARRCSLVDPITAIQLTTPCASLPCLSTSGTGNCGAFGCVEWERNVLSWRKLGIGRMLVFLAVEGALFYLIIALIELKVTRLPVYV